MWYWKFYSPILRDIDLVHQKTKFLIDMTVWCSQACRLHITETVLQRLVNLCISAPICSVLLKALHCKFGKHGRFREGTVSNTTSSMQATHLDTEKQSAPHQDTVFLPGLLYTLQACQTHTQKYIVSAWWNWHHCRRIWLSHWQGRAIKRCSVSSMDSMIVTQVCRNQCPIPREGL